MSWKLTQKPQSRLDPAASCSPSASNPTIIPAPTPSLLACTPRPLGILNVTLHRGAGFSAADEYQELFKGYERNLGTPSRPAYYRQFHLPYALLDYERSQVSVASVLGTTESPQWSAEHGATCKFDVSWAAELTVYLYLRDPKASKGSQDVFLGMVRLNPFDGATVSGPQWLQAQSGGTGKICLSLDYSDVENATFEIDRSEFGRLSSSGDVLQVTKKDTGRQYARKSIRSAAFVSPPEAAAPPRISHPFIAPLAFAFQGPKGTLQLWTPFVSGGHLFSHLQRPQRFDVDRSRFYAAEIVCALEYLHDGPNIHSWLKPRNVMLDSLGHATLCGSGLFRSQIRTEEPITHGTPEYPSPELLIGEGNESRASDWWTLGVFLYEMLAGLPPFYDDNTANMHRNILEQPIQFPESLPPSATDILTKLLNRRPEERLGAGGASEVKAHAFFQAVDWQKLLQRRYEPVFKPDCFVGFFEQHGVGCPPEQRPPPQGQFPGFSYIGPVLPEPESKKTETSRPLLFETPRSTVEKDDGWDFDLANLSLAKDTIQKTDRVAATRALGQAVDQQNVAMVKALLANGARCDFEESDRPYPKHDRLDDGGCDFPDESELEEFTPPIVRAVKHGNMELVRLLLANGADANAGYHDLKWDLYETSRRPRAPIGFSCGRVVQLAMELDRLETVRLLLDSGADICLAQPVWPVSGHRCDFVPRAVYQRVTAGLRAAAATAAVART